jgi:hypothetical protein
MRHRAYGTPGLRCRLFTGVVRQSGCRWFEPGPWSQLTPRSSKTSRSGLGPCRFQASLTGGDARLSVRRTLIELTTSRRLTMLDLLIRGGLIIDGSGNRSFYRRRRRRERARPHPARRHSGHRGQARHRRHQPRGLPRVHRHARALRAGDPRRAAARAEGPPGHHHEADRHRRQLLRPIPLPR